MSELGKYLALVRLIAEHDWRACPSCRAYVEGRGGAIAQAIARQSLETGERPELIVDRFMTGVHERHRDGHSLATTTTEGDTE